MSFKITGLDKLQNQFKNAERAMRSLDGTIASVNFDPNEPASIQAAIAQMENAIDEKIAPYRGNPIVQNVASQMKKTYREQIFERAAFARIGQEAKAMTSEELPSVLRQIENTITDLRWADRPSFARHIKKLSRLLHAPELDEMTCKLTEGTDLEAWLKAGRRRKVAWSEALR
jgi:hypothetical protein